MDKTLSEEVYVAQINGKQIELRLRLTSHGHCGLYDFVEFHNGIPTTNHKLPMAAVRKKYSK